MSTSTTVPASAPASAGTSSAVRTGSWLRLGLSVTALSLVATACGGSNEESSTRVAAAPSAAAASAAVPEIASMLPPELRSKGKLDVAAEVYPPAVIAGKDGGEPTGWEIATGQALGEVLDIPVEFAIVPFDSIVPGLQSNRYDMAMGEISASPERTEVLTFVVTHASEEAYMVQKDSDITGLTDLQGLCGHKVAVLLGSVEAQAVQGAEPECAPAGKPAMTVQTYNDQAQANLALSSGRADVSVGSASQLAYTIDQTKGEFKLAGGYGTGTSTGIALADTAYEAQLAKALQAGVNHLIENGRLKEILDQYNGGQGGVTEATIVP